MTERRWSWLATKTSSSSTQEQNIDISQTQTSCYGVHRVRKVLGGDIESGEGKNTVMRAHCTDKVLPVSV